MTSNKANVELFFKANLTALQRVTKTLDAMDARLATVSQSLNKMSSEFGKTDSKVSKTKKKIDGTSKALGELGKGFRKIGTAHPKVMAAMAKAEEKAGLKKLAAIRHVQAIKERYLRDEAKKEQQLQSKKIKMARESVSAQAASIKQLTNWYNKGAKQQSAAAKKKAAEERKIENQRKREAKQAQRAHNKLYAKARREQLQAEKRAAREATQAKRKEQRLQVALAIKAANEEIAAKKKAAKAEAALVRKKQSDAKMAHKKEMARIKFRMAMIRNSQRTEIALQNARRARLSEMSGALSGVNQHLRSISRGFAVMGTASVAGILAVTKVAKDFEASLVRAATVTTGTGADFESNFSRMSKAAIDLANRTEHTAAAVGEGMNFMAMAGFNASDIIASMPTVAKLATAANLSMADSANIVTNAMAGFGITSDKIMEEFEQDTGKMMSRVRATEILAQKTNDVANVLVGAFTASNVSLTDLNESLKIAGPVAKQLNIPIEDLTAAIGLLGNVGVRGTEAGTGLKRAMVAMVNPSKQSAKAMRQLGISSEMISGKDGLLRVVSALEVQRDRMRSAGKEAEFLGRVFEVFGERAGPKMAALVAQGTQSLISLSSGIEKAKQENLASIIEERQLNTLSGALNKLLSNIRTFAKELGDKMLPNIKELVKDFEGAAIAARNLDDRIKDFIVTSAKVGAIGGGIGFFATKVIEVGASLTLATFAMQQMGHSMGALVKGFALLGGKGLLLGGILVGAFSGTLAIMEEVSGKTYDIAGAFENAFAESTESIKNMFINLFQFIASMLTWVLAPLKVVGLDLEKKLNDLLLGAKDLVIDATIDDKKLKRAMDMGAFGDLPEDKGQAREKALAMATGNIVLSAKKAAEVSIANDKESLKQVKSLEKKKADLSKKFAKELQKARTKAEKKAIAERQKKELEVIDKQLKAAIKLRETRKAEAKQRMSAASLEANAMQIIEKNLRGKGQREKVLMRPPEGGPPELVDARTTAGDDFIAELKESGAIKAMAESLSRQIMLQAELASKEKVKTQEKPDVKFDAALDNTEGKLKSLADQLESARKKLADLQRGFEVAQAKFEDMAKELSFQLELDASEFQGVVNETKKLIGDFSKIAEGGENLKVMSEQIRAAKRNVVALEKNTLALQKGSLTGDDEARFAGMMSEADTEHTARLKKLDKTSKDLAEEFLRLRTAGMAEQLSKVELSKRNEAASEQLRILRKIAKELGIEIKGSVLAKAMKEAGEQADELALKWKNLEAIDPQVEIQKSLDNLSGDLFGGFKSTKFFKGMEQPVKEGISKGLKTAMSKASGQIAGAFSGVLSSIGAAAGTVAQQAFGPQIVAFFGKVGAAITAQSGGWGMAVGTALGTFVVQFAPIIGAAIGGVAGAIVEAIPIIGEAFGKAAKAIVDGAKKTAQTIFDNTAGAFKKMSDALADSLDKVVEDQRLSDAIRMAGQVSVPASAALIPAGAIGALVASIGLLVSSVAVAIMSIIPTTMALIAGTVPAAIISAMATALAVVVAAISSVPAAIVSALATVIAAVVAIIVAGALSVPGAIMSTLGAIILGPILVLFSGIAMVIMGVAGAVTAGLGILTAALGGFFASLLFKDPKFAGEDFVSQRGRAQDALAASVDRLVMALDPLWQAVMPLVGLFDYLLDVMLPLADSFANGAGFSSVLFQGFKMMAVAIGMVLLAIGYFVTGVLNLLIGAFGNPLHQFMGNLMEAIAQGVLDAIAFMMRGLADMFKKVDDLIPGSAIFSDVTTGLNNAADDAEAAADGLVPDFDDLNQSIIDGLEDMKPDLDGMHDAMQALLMATEEGAAARADALADEADRDKNAKEFGEQMTNVPSGFKVALHRFNAMDAVGGISAGGKGNILDLSNNEYFNRMSSAFSTAIAPLLGGSTPSDDVLDQLAEATDPERWGSALDSVAATFEGAAREIAELSRQMMNPDSMPGGRGPLGSSMMGRSMATESLMGGNNMIINIGEMSIDDASNPGELANMIAEKSARDHMAQGGTPFPTTKSGSNWWNGGGGRGF